MLTHRKKNPPRAPPSSPPTLPPSTVPCLDCIDGVSPYNPKYWGYVMDIPSSYIVATNTPDAGICGTSGDPNLGLIPAACHVDGPTVAPKSVQGTYYIPSLEDCSGNAQHFQCLGIPLGIGDCVTSSDTSKYKACEWSTQSHHWYVRDWVTEMAKSGPSGTPYSTMQQYCCFLPPGDLPNGQPRTTVCPPNLWYGGSACQAPASDVCAIPPIEWTPGCDYYLQQNLQTAVGQPQYAQGLFLPTVNNWVSQVLSTGGGGGTPGTLAPLGPGPSPDPNDPFIQTILKWGPSFPGTLAPALSQVCQNVTRAQIGQDTTGNLGKLCACYLPPNQYYLPGVIPQECDSLCSLAGSTGGIPIYEWGSSGTPVQKVCEQTTCVIDQVTLNYANTVSGNMNWSQVCGKCSSTTSSGGAPAGCTCIVNGINSNSINSEIPGININQECGSFSSANGGIIPPVTVPAQTVSFWDQYKWIILGLVGFAVAIGLFFLIRKI